MSTAGKVPNGNGWEREDSTQTRIKIQTARDEFAAEWRRKTIAIVVAVVSAVGGIGALVAVITFAVGRAAATDVQSLDVRVVKIEKDVEGHGSDIHEVKAAVKEMATDQKESAYRIERRVDAVLDQLQPVARKAGAPIVARPPRAVMKPTEAVTVERVP